MYSPLLCLEERVETSWGPPCQWLKNRLKTGYLVAREESVFENAGPVSKQSGQPWNAE